MGTQQEGPQQAAGWSGGWRGKAPRLCTQGLLAKRAPSPPPCLLSGALGHTHCGFWAQTQSASSCCGQIGCQDVQPMRCEWAESQGHCHL